MAVDKVTENAHRAHQQALLTILKEFDRICKQLHIPYVLFAGTLLGAVRHSGFIPWDDDVDVIMRRKDYDRFLSEAESVLNSEKFYLQKEFSQHWPMFFSKLRMNNTACLEKFHPKDSKMHQGIYIDIFPCDNAKKTLSGKMLQFYASKVVIAKSLYKRGYETKSAAKKAFMLLCRMLPLKPFLSIAKSGSNEINELHSFFAAASSYKKNVYPLSYFANSISTEFEGEKFPIPKEYDALLKQLYGDYMQLPPEEERVIKQHAILVDLENSYEIYSDYRADMSFDVLTKSIR
ncbi:MAG: LicD family protein [Oscillospiraceae bacterium]|nr:LicD family protein [Oscillospiraceae bacterium]